MTPTELHAHFAALPGAEQIGSSFAAEALARWLRRCRPLRVVEVGSGIGLLTAVIVMTLASNRVGGLVATVEPDVWCARRCIENVRRISGRVVDPCLDWSDIPHVDFLVIDGGDTRDDYYANLARRAVVFWEGNRRDQRAMFRAMWEGGRPFVTAEWKPADRSKGFHVALMEPTPAERVWFAAARLREWVRDGIARARGRAVGKKRVGA